MNSIHLQFINRNHSSISTRSINTSSGSQTPTDTSTQPHAGYLLSEGGGVLAMARVAPARKTRARGR
eukprot:7344662-Prymnesium_polylepis.1